MLIVIENYFMAIIASGPTIREFDVLVTPQKADF